jgi:hypothetical protein
VHSRVMVSQRRNIEDGVVNTLDIAVHEGIHGPCQHWHQLISVAAMGGMGK